MRASQANSTAPKLVMMRLTGYDSWVAWYLVLMELVKYITSEQVKCHMVLDSLSVSEDKKFLIGVIDFHQMLTAEEYSHHFGNKEGPNQVRLLEQEG